jgi:hypothetical protein
MKVKQLSLFLENRPGALHHPTQLLADAKLNILALSLADTQQFGILRLIINDWEEAVRVLEKEGYIVKVNDMIALEVPDAPGGLAAVLGALERTHIKLEYMYGFTQRTTGRGLVLLRFDDPDRAIVALQKQKINPIRRVDLFR